MNSKRKIEINIVEVQTYKILIQINSTIYSFTIYYLLAEFNFFFVVVIELTIIFNNS